MIKLQDILNEIEFYESRKLYKLSDQVTHLLIKQAAEAINVPGFKEILEPQIYTSQIRFLKEVCPDIMNPDQHIQMYESFKDYMLRNMQAGKKPKEIYEAYFNENHMNPVGNFKTCFEKMYSKLTGRPFKKGDSIDMSQGATPQGQSGNDYGSAPNSSDSSIRQVNPM
jgi:hypothetical protein